MDDGEDISSKGFNRIRQQFNVDTKPLLPGQSTTRSFTSSKHAKEKEQSCSLKPSALGAEFEAKVAGGALGKERKESRNEAKLGGRTTKESTDTAETSQIGSESSIITERITPQRDSTKYVDDDAAADLKQKVSKFEQRSKIQNEVPAPLRGDRQSAGSEKVKRTGSDPRRRDDEPRVAFSGPEQFIDEAAAADLKKKVSRFEMGMKTEAEHAAPGRQPLPVKPDEQVHGQPAPGFSSSYVDEAALADLKKKIFRFETQMTGGGDAVKDTDSHVPGRLGEKWNEDAARSAAVQTTSQADRDILAAMKERVLYFERVVRERKAVETASRPPSSHPGSAHRTASLTSLSGLASHATPDSGRARTSSLTSALEQSSGGSAKSGGPESRENSSRGDEGASGDAAVGGQESASEQGFPGSDAPASGYADEASIAELWRKMEFFEREIKAHKPTEWQPSSTAGTHTHAWQSKAMSLQGTSGNEAAAQGLNSLSPVDKGEQQDGSERAAAAEGSASAVQGWESADVAALRRMLVQRDVQLHAERTRAKQTEVLLRGAASKTAAPRPHGELQPMEHQSMEPQAMEPSSMTITVNTWSEAERCRLQSALQAAIAGYTSALDKIRKLEDAMEEREVVAAAEQIRSARRPVTVEQV